MILMREITSGINCIDHVIKVVDNEFIIAKKKEIKKTSSRRCFKYMKFLSHSNKQRIPSFWLKKIHTYIRDKCTSEKDTKEKLASYANKKIKVLKRALSPKPCNCGTKYYFQTIPYSE